MLLSGDKKRYWEPRDSGPTNVLRRWSPRPQERLGNAKDHASHSRLERAAVQINPSSMYYRTVTWLLVSSSNAKEQTGIETPVCP